MFVCVFTHFCSQLLTQSTVWSENALDIIQYLIDTKVSAYFSVHFLSSPYCNIFFLAKRDAFSCQQNLVEMRPVIFSCIIEELHISGMRKLINNNYFMGML